MGGNNFQGWTFISLVLLWVYLFCSYIYCKYILRINKLKNERKKNIIANAALATWSQNRTQATFIFYSILFLLLQKLLQEKHQFYAHIVVLLAVAKKKCVDH